VDQLQGVGKGGEPEISVRNARAVRASHDQVSAVNAHRVGAVFYNKKKRECPHKTGMTRKRMARIAVIPLLHPHMLRKSGAADLRE
jgi:hypothetical protein